MEVAFCNKKCNEYYGAFISKVWSVFSQSYEVYILDFIKNA